jgi:Protein of unknown function (DUF1570)
MRIPLLCSLCVLLSLPQVHAEDAVDHRFLQLSVDNTKHQGRKLVSDDEVCWLLKQDGRLACIELSQVTEFKKIGTVFQPFSTNEMRKRLIAEFGKKYEVDTRGSQVLIAPTGKSKACADLVETTAKSYTAYFSRRNFNLDKPETPLVTIIFPTQAEFLKYCALDQVKHTQGLRGYYSPMSNRVALYLEQPASVTRTIAGDVGLPYRVSPPDILGQLTHFGAPPADTGFRDTLTHETTHQLGFNSGLHSRLGDDPTWIVEGIAMLFEGDANRDDARQQTTVTQRMNRERHVWFQQYSQSRRKPKSLEEFLTTNALFTTNTLDAYSESWALTFFLAETRPSNLSSYLKKLANRTDLGEYSPMKRLNDFKAIFGKDIPHLETQYLRFMKDLESAPQPKPAATTATDPFTGTKPRR